MASDTKPEDIGRATTVEDIKQAEKSPEPPKQSSATTAKEETVAPPRKPSASRKPDLRPSTSNPTPRIEPGRVESIGPKNLQNNITVAKEKGLQLGGAEGEKQKAEETAKKVDTPQDSHILK